jgi:hypothetical protein
MVFILFALAIVALDPRLHLVESFGVFYVVGAMAGFALEAMRSGRARTAALDYGLNRERLFLAFTMSGVAGCGGVILFVLLLTSTVGDMVSQPTASFDPSVVVLSPVLVLVAAAFGLAPSRLFNAITGIREQALIQADLAASTATGGTDQDGTADGGGSQ